MCSRGRPPPPQTNEKQRHHHSCRLALVGLIGLGAIESNKKAESARAQNVRYAERCIEVHNTDAIKGTVTDCDRVKTGLLTETQLASFSPVFEKHKEIKAKKAAEKAANEKWRAEQKAKQAKLKAERGEWSYSGYTDDATGKYAKTARLTSKNSMNFGWPYSGIQYGEFEIRNHPRYGVDAMLSIDKGQLLCDSYNNTTVLVRFDDRPATRYACADAADHSSDIVFIRNVAGLEAGMKTAKKMFITVSVYQEGSRTWEFNVKGYDRSKV